MFETILKFFKKMGKKEETKTAANSKDAAKERLHLVLMQDRANVSADFLELMKQEIIEVIKKYIDVDESAIDVRLTNQKNDDDTNGAPALYANIPILNIKNDARKIDKKDINLKEEETNQKDIKDSKKTETNDIIKENNEQKKIDDLKEKHETKKEKEQQDKKQQDNNKEKIEEKDKIQTNKKEEQSENKQEKVEQKEETEETKESTKEKVKSGNKKRKRVV